MVNCVVFARKFTKCGSKRHGRPEALNSLMVGRCAGVQGLGGPYLRGAEVNTEHESIYKLAVYIFSFLRRVDS